MKQNLDISTRTRRLDEKDKFAILIKTKTGVKIIETFPNLEELKREYAHYAAFAKSPQYPKNTEPPFPTECKNGVNFDGPIKYSVLEGILGSSEPKPLPAQMYLKDERQDVPKTKRIGGLVSIVLGGIILINGCEYLKNKYFPLQSSPITQNVQTNNFILFPKDNYWDIVKYAKTNNIVKGSWEEVYDSEITKFLSQRF